MDTVEKWKPINRYEGRYEVSSKGRVRSLPRDTNNQFSSGCIKNHYVDRYGYHVVTLVKNNKIKNCTVHRLVAQAFIPNIDNKPQVNHVNGVKTDNRVENLEWCSASSNQKHRFDVLNHVTHNRLLNKDNVFYILHKNEKSIKELSEKFNVSIACIKAVRSGRNYKKWFDEYMGLSVDQLVEYGWVKLKEAQS